MGKKGLHLLLVGASGAVGREVLAQALTDARITRVTAPTRQPLGIVSAKLDNPIVNFAALPADAPWWRCDAVVCTLGTTIRKAGSKSAFAAIDRDLPVAVARLAITGGAMHYALNSSLGANPQGNFYLRTKWEAEEGVRKLGFVGVTIVRPSLIDAEREEPRLGERLGLVAARLLNPLIPRRYRSVTPNRIAKALLDGVLKQAPGVDYIESQALQQAGD